MRKKNPRRRDILYGGGAAMLASLFPFLAQAVSGRCLPREGYKLINSDDQVNPSDLIGQPAPNFYQLDINTSSPTYQSYIGPQDYHGKIVLFNLWATWCGPCIEELPIFNEINRTSDVQVLTFETSARDRENVNYSQFTFPVLDIKGKVPFSYRMCEGVGTQYEEYFDRSKGEIYRHMGRVLMEHIYGNNGALPLTFIIDKEGVVRQAKQGVFNNLQELGNVVEQLR